MKKIPHKDKIHYIQGFEYPQIIETEQGDKIHKALTLLEIDNFRVVLRKHEAKHIKKALLSMTKEQKEYIKKHFAQIKYDSKQRGQQIDNDTIINIIINKII